MGSLTFDKRIPACLGFKKAIPVLAAGLLLILAAVPLFSQGSAGRILGSISDQSGAAIPGATLTIEDVQRGTSRTLTTDTAGAYNAPNLLPGTYKVRAEFKGFRTVERQNIALEVGQDIRVDLSLQPGEQTQTVTVTETIPLVETTNAELGGTISNQIINELPLNGRNFKNLLQLRPGVMIYPGGSGGTQSTNGLRPHDNVYLVDGIYNSEPFTGGSVMNGTIAAGDAATILSIDAIEEFKTQENPRAEYGWKPGAIVNVGIKSGTNTLHGTAYAYGRTDSWDARNYFNQGPQQKAPLGLEQYGGSLGGPIKKDKLFYFVNYEGQRYELGAVTPIQSPITAAGVGPATQNLIGACKAAGSGATALSLQLAGLGPGCVPLSNYPGLFPVNDGSNPADPSFHASGLTNTNSVNGGIGKVDYHLSDHHSLHGMYFISQGFGHQNDAPNQVNNVWLSDLYARAQTGSGSWVWTPNSSWVNEARVGYTHYYQSFQTGDASDNPANYTLNGNTYHFYTGVTKPDDFGFPRIRIQSFSTSSFQLGGGVNWPKIVGPDGITQFVDHVSYLRGNHAFKFGGESLLKTNVNQIDANARGPLRFRSLQTYFTGVPNQAMVLIGNVRRNLSNQAYAAFVQDDWRVKPRLTVNLGVRYEINTPVKEDNGLFGSFDPTRGLVQVGKQIGSIYNTPYKNFAPRLGVAWDVQGNGKTVVRAGGGIVYEQLTYDMFDALGNLVGLRVTPTGAALFANGQQIPSPGNIAVISQSFTGSTLTTLASNWANNGPNTPLYNIGAVTPACGDGTPLKTPVAGVIGTPGPCLAVGVNPNLRTPYVTTWTLDIQRALTNNLSLDIGYVGNHGTNMIGLTDINQPRAGAGWTAAAIATCLNPAKLYQNCAPDSAAIQAARPYNSQFPYLNYIDRIAGGLNSNYNGLQVVATQRSSHGLSYTAGYTYSHALDDASDNWGNGLLSPANNYGSLRRQLYASSVFDVRHRFTLSLTYRLPSVKAPAHLLDGWSINSVVLAQTGTPWRIADQTTDFSGTGEIATPASGNAQGEQWNFYGKANDFESIHGLTPGALGPNNPNPKGGVPYFAPTGNPASPTANASCNAQARALDGGAPTGLAQAALANLGCYGVNGSVLMPPAYGSFGTLGRNPFRDTGFKNWDVSLTKVFKFKERLTTQFRAEFFNILNHPNFANPYGGPGGPTASLDPSVGPPTPFAYSSATPDAASSNPVLGSGGSRAIQLGLKLIF
jgi:hypothetical protein